MEWSTEHNVKQLKTLLRGMVADVIKKGSINEIIAYKAKQIIQRNG
jgi:hypothetical protein